MRTRRRTNRRDLPVAGRAGFEIHRRNGARGVAAIPARTFADCADARRTGAGDGPPGQSLVAIRDPPAVVAHSRGCRRSGGTGPVSRATHNPAAPARLAYRP